MIRPVPLSRVTALSFLAASLAASLPAQQSFTLPGGFDGVEGDGSASAPLSLANGRFQQIAAGVPVAPGTNLVRLELRRDGQRMPIVPFQSQQVDVTVRMGPGVFERFGSRFDANWIGGAPIEVFARKRVALPDWGAQPGTPPAAWDVALAFDRPFPVPAARDLVWELVLENGSVSFPFYPADAQSSTYAARSSTRLGVGCSTANGVMTLDSIAQTYANDAVALRYRVTGGPSRAPVVLALGSSDPNSLLGLCASLRTNMNGLVTVLGGTDDLGRLPWVSLHWHWSLWSGAPIPVPVYAQAFSPTGSGTGPVPVAASNGSLAVVQPPFQGVDHRTLMLVAHRDPQAVTGALEYRLGVVTRFTY